MGRQAAVCFMPYATCTQSCWNMCYANWGMCSILLQYASSQKGDALNLAAICIMHSITFKYSIYDDYWMRNGDAHETLAAAMCIMKSWNTPPTLFLMALARAIGDAFSTNSLTDASDASPLSVWVSERGLLRWEPWAEALSFAACWADDTTA